jgi:hypothetical protein
MDEQQERWEDSFARKPGMFGDQPSAMGTLMWVSTPGLLCGWSVDFPVMFSNSKSKVHSSMMLHSPA